jgi:hypothetical protein
VALAADAQRERALASLRNHYLQGRLDADELALRADQALRARTTADLSAALHDLPRLGEVVERARVIARLVGYVAALTAFWVAASLFLLVTLVVLALAGTGGDELLAVPAVWLLLSAALVLCGARRLRSTRRVRGAHGLRHS